MTAFEGNNNKDGTQRGRKKQLADEAWRYFNVQDIAAAKAAFDRFLHLDPLDEGALQGKIACLRKEQAFGEAERLIADALAHHPTSIGILCERAWLELDQKHAEKAISAFEVVLRLPQKDDSMFLWQLSLLRQQRRFDEAEAVAAAAKAEFPASAKLKIESGWLQFHQGRYDEAERAFSEARQMDGKSAAARQGTIASFRMQGRFAEAEIEADGAERLFPTDVGILAEIAWLNFDLGRYSEAEGLFRRILIQVPADALALVNCAWALLQEADPASLEEASSLCRQALALSHSLPQALGCLGVISFRQGRLQDAEKYLLRSIKEDPLLGHFADLGALYAYMGRYEEAERRFNEGLTVKPGEAALHLEMGNLYAHTDRLKKATQAFRQALALDPAHPGPPRALAIIAMEKGDLSEGERLVRVALKKLDASKQWKLRLTLCQILARMSEETGDQQLLDEALKEVKAARKYNGAQAESYFYEGIIRFRLEDYAAALRAFERCLKLDAGHLQADTNAKRVQTFIRQTKARSRASAMASGGLALVILVQLAALWFFRCRYGAAETAIITTTMITILVPICLGLLVVAVVLPSLTKLKLTGLEAELSVPSEKALPSGPKGEIGFGNAMRGGGRSPG